MRWLLATLSAAALIARGDARAESLRVGGRLLAAPGGEVATELEDFDGRFRHGLETAWGASAHVEYAVTGALVVGVVQRVLLPITLHRPGHTSGVELDTMLRVGGRVAASPRLDFAAHALAGYSFLQVDEHLGVDGDDRPEEIWCRGVIVGAVVSAGYRLSPRLALVGELGYTRGFQSTTVDVTAPSWGAPGPHRLTIASDLVQLGVGGEVSF